MVYLQEYEQYQEPPKSPTEVIIGNIIRAVICIFIICVAFFVLVLLVSVLDTGTGIQYTNYTGDFPINDPLVTNVVYTSNPLLSHMTVKHYNSSNLTFGNVDATFWTFDTSTSAVTISGGLNHFDSSVRIDALTDYAESPHLSVLTAWSLSLIILAIAGIFGLVGWRHYDNQRYR